MQKSCFLPILLIILLTGCDSKAGQDLNRIAKEGLDKIRPATHDAKQAATGEVEKLFTFEYKIVDISSNTDAAELESQLNALGKLRWECFHIETENFQHRVFCRRRPKSYLRYLSFLP